MEGHILKDYLRLGILPEIAGGEIQPGEGTSGGYAGDAGTGEAPQPAGEGESGGEGYTPPVGEDTGGQYEIDGQTYSRDQIPEDVLAEAIDALNNRDSWTASYKQRDMRMAGVAKALEYGFGKPLTQFNDADHDDLRMMSILNNRLRRDQPFKQAFTKMLGDLTQRFGAGRPPATAPGQQQPGQAPQPPQVPPELLERIDRMETREVNRATAATTRSLRASVNETIARQAGDLKGYVPWIRTQVYNELYREFEDPQLIAMDWEGTLDRQIARTTNAVLKEFRKLLADGAKANGEAVRTGKTGAAPPPMKGTGGTPPAPAKTREAQRGRGLGDMHEGMRRGLEQLQRE